MSYCVAHEENSGYGKCKANGNKDVGSDWYYKYCNSSYFSDCPIYKDKANSGGCFITTAVCKTLGKSDDCSELMEFRHFRDTYMHETPEMLAEIEEYYEIAPKICIKINDYNEQKINNIYFAIWENFLKSAFEALKNGENKKTHDIYKDMVLSLKSEFLNGIN
jgi:hypothetical protein